MMNSDDPAVLPMRLSSGFLAALRMTGPHLPEGVLGHSASAICHQVFIKVRERSLQRQLGGLFVVAGARVAVEAMIGFVGIHGRFRLRFSHLFDICLGNMFVEQAEVKNRRAGGFFV